MPQGVDVDGAATIVGLYDELLVAASLDAGQPGEDQVAVKDADQPVGYVEQRFDALQRGGDRFLRVTADNFACACRVASPRRTVSALSSGRRCASLSSRASASSVTVL